MTLYFVGLGLGGVEGVSLEGARVLRGCRVVYLERYTSPAAPTSKELSEFLGRDVVEVSREFVEDGRAILSKAREGDVALACSGDPMVATTHQELRVRAAREGLDTRVIHGVSIVGCISGELGLHQYRFGKIVTVTASNAAVASVLDTVHWNLLRGLHTLLLLEWAPMRRFTPSEALKMLKEADEALKLGVFNDSLFAIVAARVGGGDQLVRLGRLKDLVDFDYGDPPYSIVVPADLHFTEAEALETFFNCVDCSKVNNTIYVKSRANLMVPKYVENTRRALAEVRRKLSERGCQVNTLDLLENVDCYSSDALRFLNEGKSELAILSIGYAEGLLDSLRFLRLVDVPW